MALSLYALTVSGHFPAEHRAPSLTTPLGRLLLWGTLVLCAGLTVLLIQFAWRHVPLYAAAIGGGAMLLAAPLLLRPLPDSFVNGRRGLLVFAGLAFCLVLIAETLVT